MNDVKVAPKVERDEYGAFKKGVSGNPAGRPPGRKNELTGLKQDLEIAIRKNLTPAKIQAVLNKMVDLALEGNVAAGKLILDKAVTNARETDDVQGGDGGMTFVIKNVTVQKETGSDDSIIDVTPQETE